MANFIFLEAENDELEAPDFPSDENTEKETNNNNNNDNDTNNDDTDETDDSNLENEESTNDDSTENEDDSMDDEESEMNNEVDNEAKLQENKKRYNLLLSYKKLLFINKSFYKEFANSDIFVDDEQEKALNSYIREKVYKIIKNISIVMEDKIETLDIKILETIYTKCSSETELLIDLYNKGIKPDK